MKEVWEQWLAPAGRELPAALPELLTDTGGLAEVRRLEAELAGMHGVPFALGLSSGTAALEAALFALQVGPGDEVICPALAPAYAVLPVLNAGATPVWCDVERDTLALDPVSLAGHIGPRTRAVLVIHMAGLPARLEPVLALARAHGLAVIEDCAEGLGGFYAGHRLGTLGDVGCLSFQHNKPLGAGEGGALLTARRDVYERALVYGQHPARLQEEVTLPELQSLVPTGWGHNQRLHPLAAWLVRAGLPRLDELAAARREALAALRRALAGLPGIDFPRPLPGTVPAANRAVLLYRGHFLGGPSQEEVVLAAREEGIPLDSLPPPPFTENRLSPWAPAELLTYPCAAVLAGQAVSIGPGGGPPLTGELIHRVARFFRRVLA